MAMVRLGSTGHASWYTAGRGRMQRKSHSSGRGSGVPSPRRHSDRWWLVLFAFWRSPPDTWNSHSAGVCAWIMKFQGPPRALRVLHLPRASLLVSLSMHVIVRKYNPASETSFPAADKHEGRFVGWGHASHSGVGGRCTRPTARIPQLRASTSS